MPTRPRRWLPPVLLGSLLFAAACGTNRDLIEVSSPTPRPTVGASVVASPTSLPTPAARPTRVPTPAPTPLPLSPIQGLFTDPRPIAIVAQDPLPPLPPATIEVDASTRLDDTLLFDVETQTATNLGRGFRGEFSPDGTRMSWVRITPEPAGEVRVIDLASGDQRRLGSGVDSAPWIDDATVLSVNATANARIAIDVATGVARPAPTFDPTNEPFVSQVRGDTQLVQIADGLPAVFEVRDRPSGTMLLRLEAEAASLVSDNELVIATPASGPDLASNIFLVVIDTAAASFVASTQLTSRPLIAVSATANLVAWSQRFCSPDATIRVFNRATGDARELTGAGWVTLTSDDLLALGEFGARSLLDIESGRYTTVLPAPQNRVTWSPNYRYASVGAQLEEGSRCR